MGIVHAQPVLVIVLQQEQNKRFAAKGHFITDSSSLKPQSSQRQIQLTREH